MPVEIRWLVENKVSYYHYFGEVTIREFQEAMDTGLQLLNNLPEDAPPVHTLQDSSAVTKFVGSIITAGELTRAIHQHPKMGWTVNVSLMNPVVCHITYMLGNIHRSRSQHVSTVTEALHFLSYLNPSLTFPAEDTLNQLPLRRLIDIPTERRTNVKIKSASTWQPAKLGDITPQAQADTHQIRSYLTQL